MDCLFCYGPCQEGDVELSVHSRFGSRVERQTLLHIVDTLDGVAMSTLRLEKGAIGVNRGTIAFSEIINRSGIPHKVNKSLC